jgi:hypothetical protein
MAEHERDTENGSRPERGTGQRQDHRAAPPGHRVPGEGRNLGDTEDAEDEQTTERSGETGEGRD